MSKLLNLITLSSFLLLPSQAFSAQNSAMVPIIAYLLSDDAPTVVVAHTKEEAKSNLLQNIANLKTSDTQVVLDTLAQSYMQYSDFEAKDVYKAYFGGNAQESIWETVSNNDAIREALYASRFPLNPYYVKNLSDFKARWGDTKFNSYSNLAVGLSINAKESGIFDEINGGETKKTHVIDFDEEARYDKSIQGWIESNDFSKYGDIDSSELFAHIQKKYDLSEAQRDNFAALYKKVKKVMINTSNTNEVDYAFRKNYSVTFDAWNAQLKILGKTPKSRTTFINHIKSFIASKSISNSSFLINNEDYLGKNGLDIVDLRRSTLVELRGDLGLVPKENNVYKLMSFYDLAELKIANDKIAPIIFEGGSKYDPDWPIFKNSLAQTPWQIFTIEQSAQKQECQYAKSRFFETDESRLIASYPNPSVNDSYNTRRFLESTTGTHDYNDLKYWYKPSEYAAENTIYRVLEHGGVCGRQSTMGQHVNECLNRPTIGVGQPGHRAWVGVYKDTTTNTNYVKVGYKVGTTESASSGAKLIYNRYTNSIRSHSIERFAGVVGGTSRVGVKAYNQSMMLQHIAKIAQDNGLNPEITLRKAISKSVDNVDAWYQLALYYASMGNMSKIENLAKEYMDNYANIFEPEIIAENRLGIVVGKNIMYAMSKMPSVDEYRGSDAKVAKEKVFAFLDKYVNDKRTIITYREQNEILVAIYKMNDSQNRDVAGFEKDIELLIKNYIDNSVFISFSLDEVGYISHFFREVPFDKFEGYDKAELFDRLREMASTTTNYLHLDFTSIVLEVGTSGDTAMQQIVLNDTCDDVRTCNMDMEPVRGLELGFLTRYSINGDTKLIPESQRDIEGFSTLLVQVKDQDSKIVDLNIRVAKMAQSREGKNGKLLKINDPSLVEPSHEGYLDEATSTGLVAWVDPKDNTHLEEGKVYNSTQKLLLDVHNGKTGEIDGFMTIFVKDLALENLHEVYSEKTYAKRYEKASSEVDSVYFLLVNEDRRKKMRTSIKADGETTYYKIFINAQDENGNLQRMIARVTRVAHKNKSDMYFYPNYGSLRGKAIANTIQISIDLTDKIESNIDDENGNPYYYDNTKLVVGKRYKSIEPIKIDVIKEVDDTLIERIRVDLNTVIQN